MVIFTKITMFTEMPNLNNVIYRKKQTLQPPVGDLISVVKRQTLPTWSKLNRQQIECAVKTNTQAEIMLLHD